MNYPLRKFILSFLMNEVGAEVHHFALYLQKTHPHEAFYACLDVFERTIKERLINVVAGAPDAFCQESPDFLLINAAFCGSYVADGRGLQMTLPAFRLSIGHEMGC